MPSGALWLPWWWWRLLALAAILRVEADTEIRTIGEFDTVGTGNIHIGMPLTLSKDAPNFMIARAVYRTILMFTEWLNNVRGGILIQGTYRSAHITLIDDHNDVAHARTATRRLLNDSIQLLLGPIGEDLTRAVAEEVNASGATMVAPAAFEKPTFQGRPQVFGIESPTERALPEAFSLVAATASPPRSVAYFAQNSVEWTDICSNVQTLAATHGMTYLNGVTISNSMSVSAAVDWMITQRPELIVGCGSGEPQSLCEQFLAEAERKNLNSKVFIATMCVSSNGFFSRMGNSGRWVLGAVPWTSSMPYTSAPGFGDWTPQRLQTEYSTYFLEDVVQEAASTWAALCMLVAAIEQANSTDPALVATALQSLDLPTIFGNISFDQDGQSQVPWSIVQIQQLQTVPSLLSPFPEAEMIYPDPDWAERPCTHNDIRRSRYGYDSNGFCVFCPEVATFNDTLMIRLCGVCQASLNERLVTSGNTSYCQPPCPLGSAGQDCSPCLPGEYGANSLCYKCTEGTYSNSSGSSACTDCPAGSYASIPGLSSCSLCKPGTAVRTPGAFACVTCDFGKNASLAGMTECILCKPGWVARTEGNSHCDPCPAGTRSLWGSQSCEPCPVNSFQPVAGNDTCLADSMGQLSAQIGTVEPMNDFGYWARSIGDMEFCKFDPGACRQNKTCARGHTGRQCLVCLPGYARSKMSCFSCPHRALNIAMTSLVFVLAVVAALLGSRFVISSMGRPQDTVVIVLIKQGLNHCVTMSVCYTVLITLIRQRRLVLSEDHLWAAEALAAPLNFFDGCIPSETIIWSISCLLQPFVDHSMVERLQNVQHASYYDASLAADRASLKSGQMQTELTYLGFWVSWPVCFIVICNTIGFSMLYTQLRRNKEFYASAYQFYKEVKEQGFKKIEKKYMERTRRAYIDAYFSRINGIWSPVSHVLRVQTSRKKKHVSFSLYCEESTILRTTIMFTLYAPVGRALIRPILCLRLDGSSTGAAMETLTFSQSAVACSSEDPLLWIATFLAFFWFVIVPGRLYFRLWKVHDRLHLPELLREFGFSTCGYKWDYWWWDPVVFIRKALCFVVEAMPFISEKERIMGLLVLSICFFVLEFSLSPYDDRCSGLFHHLEIQQLAFFVFTVLCLQLLDELLVSVGSFAGTVCIVLAAVLSLLHVLYISRLIYSIVVNVLDLLVKAFDQPQLRNKRIVKTIMKYLTAAYNARMRDSPYIAYDPLYGWVTICGSHGDGAVPPYIPKGSMAKKYKDNRPKLSEAPVTPEIAADGRVTDIVEIANCWQRMELQRILNMSLTHIAASHESGPVFSLSIIEFVVRVAFVLDKGSRSALDAPPGPEEVDRHVWAKALLKSDPLTLKETTGQGRDQGEINLDEHPEERAHLQRVMLMEEELPKVFGDARRSSLGELFNAAVGASAETPNEEDAEGRSNADVKDETGLSTAEKEKMMKLKHQRYQSLVHDMFTPSTFRRGLTLLKLQFALMQLQSLPRSDLIYWLDLFEDRWLHEKAATNGELRRMAGHVADASEESAIFSAKPKKAATALAGDEVFTCEVAVQATPMLKGYSSYARQSSYVKDKEPDPSLKITLRWLYFVMEFRNCVSISSVRKAMRPIDKRRDKLMLQLKKLEEDTKQEEHKIRELQGTATKQSSRVSTAPAPPTDEPPLPAPLGHPSNQNSDVTDTAAV